MLTFPQKQSNSAESLLACTECKQPVGVEDKAAAGSVRLFKWSVAIQNQDKRFSKFMSSFQRNRDYGWTVFSIQRIMAAQLLALIDEQAVYRFLLYSGDMEEAKDALMVSEKQILQDTVLSSHLFSPSKAESLIKNKKADDA